MSKEQESSSEMGANQPVEQIGAYEVTAVTERSDTSLPLGRERPDLSGEFFNPDDPQATAPYLITHTREIPLELGSAPLSEAGTQPPSAAVGGAAVALVLELTGDLDLFSAQGFFYPLLNRALAEFSNVSATPRVAILGVDLSQLDFIDSAGLKEMIELRRRTVNLPGRLAVAIGPPETHVGYAWKLGKFDTFFITRRTIEEAIAVAVAELAT